MTGLRHKIGNFQFAMSTVILKFRRTRVLVGIFLSLLDDPWYGPSILDQFSGAISWTNKFFCSNKFLYLFVNRENMSDEKKDCCKKIQKQYEKIIEKLKVSADRNAQPITCPFCTDTRVFKTNCSLVSIL